MLGRIVRVRISTSIIHIMRVLIYKPLLDNGFNVFAGRGKHVFS